MAQTFDELFKNDISRVIYEAEGDAPADPLAALNPPDEAAAPATDITADQAAADAAIFGTEPLPKTDEPTEAEADAAGAPANPEDTKVISYEKKVENIISFLKQLGYAKVDHKIDEAKNSIVVIGKLSPEEETMINELAADQAVRIKIRHDSVGNSNVTRINLENIIDIPTFKELLANEEKAAAGATPSPI